MELSWSRLLESIHKQLKWLTVCLVAFVCIALPATALASDGFRQKENPIGTQFSFFLEDESEKDNHGLTTKEDAPPTGIRTSATSWILCMALCGSGWIIALHCKRRSTCLNRINK